MQTFIVSWNMKESAEMLDNKRLGKQRVECLQIFRALAGQTKGWRNHPAVLMWAGHEHALCLYAQNVREAWIGRGFSHTIVYPDPRGFPFRLPPWWGEGRLLESHRSNLLRKDPQFYARYEWNVPSNLPYYWPVTKDMLAVERVLGFCL